MKKEVYVRLYNSTEIERKKLERQVDFLLSEMVQLNQGLGCKPDYETTVHTNWMAHKAGLAIKKLHEMRK